MEMMYCPVCSLASFYAKYCRKCGCKMVARPLNPATNTICPFCHAGGIFPEDKFCGSCGKETFIFSPTVREIGLFVRAVNCLESEGINTLWALLQKTVKELSKIEGLGESTLGEIKYKVIKLGFKLREK